MGRREFQTARPSVDLKPDASAGWQIRLFLRNGNQKEGPKAILSFLGSCTLASGKGKTVTALSLTDPDQNRPQPHRSPCSHSALEVVADE